MPSKKDSIVSGSTSPASSLRIVVLGSSGVGKSAIVMQYVRGVFIESYDPTLEDSFSKRVKLGGNYDPIDVEILDTAGTDQFAAMRDMYIGNGDAFILVYAVDSKASFNEACNLYNRIKTVKSNKKCNVLMVGNKSDLSNKFRRVTYDQGSFFAHQNRSLFIEASARNNSGIQEAFETLIKLYTHSNNSKNSFKLFENDIKMNKKSLLKRKDNKDCVIM